MYYVVTGAAGFIGSKIVEALNAAGVSGIVAVDNLQQSDKVRNLAGLEIADYLDQADFLARLESFDGALEAVLHQGACSDTMESDGRYMMDNNYRYSKLLLDWCQEAEVPLLYASSAAVYGAGQEFREERACARPLSVYGPNEAHKGRMASVACHAYHQLVAGGRVRLFVGSGGYGNGEQRRDFVHVDDVVDANLWFLEHREVSGIFNCGTGRAQSFNE